MPDASSSTPVDLISQLMAGPTLREVATAQLRSELKTLYPPLDIDPDRSMVVTPVWEAWGHQVVHGNPLFESLTDVLIRLARSQATVTYLDGEHFLTAHPGDELMLQLPVRIDVIGRRLNALARLLFVIFQEKNLDYWNEPTSPNTPRWQRFSQILHKLWDIEQQPGWSTDECAMARALFHYPQLAQRLPNDKYLSRAYLIDLDVSYEGTHEHLMMLDCTVLIGKLDKRSMILSHSLSRGLQRFDSLDSLGESLQLPAFLLKPGWVLQWRLFEPEGNFFDHLACTLIALENSTIADSEPTGRQGPDTWAGSTANGFNDMEALQPANFNWVKSLVPPWLEDASTPDVARYSRHLLDLVQVRNQADGKTFCDDIPPIRDFALQALRDRIALDHPDDAPVQLADIEISITSLQVWGTFIPPGATETQVLSLAELALQNLIALPLGNKVLQAREAAELPEWLTVSYVEQLITQVDIGTTYPALIKSKLLDDTQQAAEREQLYISHLRVELPMLALQLKIRGQAGLDETGYRYVCAVMEPRPEARYIDGQQIVIRPMAFGLNGSTDDVTNMYIIGPSRADTTPCLLYRPLLEHSLLQYPSETNLLYAIKHSGELRHSVLAWLPDAVRFNYSQYIFTQSRPSPWILPQLLINPTVALMSTATVTFSDKPLEGDALSALFKANAHAMAELADRQSVSNAESRWASLKLGAWRIFSLALPFLGRTVGVAAWIWQIMDDLEQISTADQENDPQAQWSALTDLLLNLGMALAHRVATRARASTPVWEKTAPTVLIGAPEKLRIERLPDITTHGLPKGHELPLHTAGASSRSGLGLGQFLEDIKVARPHTLSKVINPGPYQHLYQYQSRYYANVGARWFEVRRNDNEDIQIINTTTRPERTGPLLVSNARGEWFVDVRLRLRGGGPKRLAKAAAKKKEEDILALTRQINTFTADAEAAKEALSQEQATLEKTTGAAADALRATYLEHVNTRRDAFQATIDQLHSLNLIESVSHYRDLQVDMIRSQLYLNKIWLDQKDADFTRNIRETLEHLNKETWPISSATRQAYEDMSTIMEGTIEKIGFAHSRFELLSSLGKSAAKVRLEYLESLPTQNLDNLKQFQVELNMRRCFKIGSEPHLRDAPDVLAQIVEDAGLSIQTSLELAAEDDQLSIGERTEALDSVVDQLAVIDQRFKAFREEFANYLVEAPVAVMREHLEAFTQRAQNNLASLLMEQRSLEQPKPPVAGPSLQRPRKIIRTRDKGLLVGQLKASESSDGSQLVEVVAPVTGKVTTFHEKTPGTWLEHFDKPPMVRATRSSTLQNGVTAGQALLDGIEAFTRKANKNAEALTAIPAEVEDIYRLQGRRFKSAATTLTEHLDTGQGSERLRVQATTLVTQLNEAGKRLFRQGNRARIALIKRQPPNAARVQWLAAQNEIDIVRLPKREQLKGHRNDFLQEYEIRDHTTRQLLWYAHFHYSTAEGPLSDFTVAHLKSRDQARLGGRFDLRNAGSSKELIEIQRSLIKRELAEALFFT